MQVNYIKFLNAIGNKALFKLVIRKSYYQIFKILSGNGQNSNQGKNTFKNLGQWLGQLTLARNKPIIMTYLNLKSLLQEAYETGQNKLEKVLPLVCKILEPSKDS